MLRFIKQKFPILYQKYAHLKRRIQIFRINRMKKWSLSKQKQYLSKMYLARIGRPLDWQHTNTYTAKMQLEKLNGNRALKAKLADKYNVRKWVQEKIGASYLIPLLGVWTRFEDIDFEKLPKQFVLKTNHGTGTNYIVKDKNKINYKYLKQLFKDWMETDYGYKNGFELHYSDIPRRIIAEKYVETPSDDLPDYKFLCFNGKPYFCWVDTGRYTRHTRNVYNLKWELQPWNQSVIPHAPIALDKPPHFDKMIELATILCQGFAHVRIDLYNVQGRIYFGEMTFTSVGGLEPIIPAQYDKMLGDLWPSYTSMEEHEQSK